jgi:tetratricopeptide (TPR) repeat protein
MKKIILLLSITLCIISSNAQIGNRDSIKHLLESDSHDTSRVLHLADLSYTYLESNPDTTMLLALKALSLAHRIGYEKGIAVSLNRIGNSYDYLGNYPKAMEAYLQALKINDKIGNLDGKQRNTGNIGFVYLLQEDYRQALNYSFKGKALAEQINNQFNACYSIGQIAEAYYHLGIFDSARLYAQMEYDLASKIKFWLVMGRSLHTLGRIHFATDQYPLALEYYRLSISGSKEAKSEYNLSRTFIDMAKVFEKLNQTDSILFYANQSLMLAQQKGFIKEAKIAAEFLSAYYHSKKNADSTLFYFGIAKAANDSLFSQQKQRQLQSLAFDEKLRQQELQAAEAKANEERKHNLQYAAIALAVVTFVIFFFLLSHSIIANQRLIKFLGILALLIVFEFLNLLLHPFLDRITNHQPVLMLLAMVCIAALLIPLHHKLEHWITHKMVEKNKKIRLAAAKKTIATLEGEQTH